MKWQDKTLFVAILSKIKYKSYHPSTPILPFSFLNSTSNKANHLGNTTLIFCPKNPRKIAYFLSTTAIFNSQSSLGHLSSFRFMKKSMTLSEIMIKYVQFVKILENTNLETSVGPET